MKKIGLAIWIGVLFFLLQSCHNAARERNNEQENVIDYDFLGCWHSVERTIPFSAVLYIASDYNFVYYGGACTTHFFSIGYWEISGDTLVLNSITPEECLHLTHFSRRRWQFDYDGRPIQRTTIENCVPYSETEFTFFENEKFLIKDSTLVHILPYPYYRVLDRYDFVRCYIHRRATK